MTEEPKIDAVMDSKDSTDLSVILCEPISEEQDDDAVGDAEHECTMQTPPKDKQQKPKDDSSQKKRKNDFKDSNRSGKKIVSKDDFDIRFLISSKDAGALIGKRGSNITFLRQHFDCSVVITDCAGPERVLSFTVHQSQVEQILASIIGYLEENNQESSVELRLLLHTNCIGSIIGKNGSKLKDIRQKNNTSIKIFPHCCPRSSERICIVQGKPENVITCIRSILDIVFSHQQIGKVFYYNPANYSINQAMQYGGYLPEPSVIKQQRGGRDVRNNNGNMINNVNNLNNIPHHHHNNRQPRARQNNPNRRFNYKMNYNQSSEMWNARNASTFYNPNSMNNWSHHQVANHMNYQLQSQVNNPAMNSYQNSFQQATAYPGTAPTSQQTPYYMTDSTSYQSTTGHQMYNTSKQSQQDVMLSATEMNNQINHLNNNPLSTNQLNNLWTSFYNGASEGRNNLAVLTVPTTNEH